MTHPYASNQYAKAFAPEYTSLHLPEANTHILLRPITGTKLQDGIGIYPLCPINAVANLESDFADLEKRKLVSLVLVTDPFFRPELEKMKKAFTKVAEFKEHYLCDLRKEHRYSTHHRYEVKRAHKLCETRSIALSDYLDEWYVLYHTLINKHGITGIQAFSKHYFAALCALKPTTIAAFSQGKMVSAHIWFEYEGKVYSHLAASSDEGYKLRSSYAVYDHSIRHFKDAGASIMDFGGGAGNEASAGLSFLKKGFSNHSAMCYLCGKILDEEKYKELNGSNETSYFPAYRMSK